MTIEQDQDAIIDRVKTSYIPTVFEVALPDGYKLPAGPNGAFLPYILISFGGQSPAAMRNQGLGSSADDIKWTAVALEVIGHTPRTTRYAVAEVRRLLEGYVPSDNWGQLTETLNGDYTVNVPEHDLWPVRYGTGIVFNTMTNAVRP